jgi:hypothetical protein
VKNNQCAMPGGRFANLLGANLLGAMGLTQTHLDEACGDANTKLPEGFSPLKPCS